MNKNILIETLKELAEQRKRDSKDEIKSFGFTRCT